MNHSDHVRLIEQGITTSGGIWADFGSGRGAFTLALADCLGSGHIHSIDRDGGALRSQQQAMKRQFPHIILTIHQADFTRPIDLPPLDGIIMANSLHFCRDRLAVVQQIRGYLKPGGRLLLVEYNTDRGNTWVPYPMSYATWQRMAKEAGFVQTDLLATRPSSFLGEFFAAVNIAP